MLKPISQDARQDFCGIESRFFNRITFSDGLFKINEFNQVATRFLRGYGVGVSQFHLSLTVTCFPFISRIVYQ